MIWIPLKNFCRVIRCTSAKWPRIQLVSGWEIQDVLSICNHVYFLWNMNRKTTVTCCEILGYHFWVHAIRIITNYKLQGWLVCLFFHFGIHPRKQRWFKQIPQLLSLSFMNHVSGITHPIQYSLAAKISLHQKIKGRAAFNAYALSKFGGTKISHHGQMHIDFLSKLNETDMI